MTTIKSWYLIAVATLLLGFSSCQDYFGDTNVDPDNPTEVVPNVLLPSAQVRMAFTAGGDASRFASVMTQHVEGIARQFLVINNYGLNGTDVNAFWENIYSVLQDLNQLKLAASGSNHYIGIAEAMEVYTIMMATDVFGAMPLSEALQGAANFNPAFDSQESVYNELDRRINSAIANLSATADGLIPGNDDIIYGGDITLWLKFAYTLQARMFIHLGLVDNSNYTKAINALANGFTSSADDAKIGFESAANQAPWYQFNNQRGDIDTNTTYNSLLRSLNDPRIGYFGIGFSIAPGAHPFFTPNQSQPLLTYTEAKFIEAEARMQTEGATNSTYQAYLDGIASSFAETGYTANYATYVAQPSVDPGQAALTLNEIMTQKYLAMFSDQESFTDWRRTGIPALTPNSGTEVPTRYPYPNAEIQYNPNAPKTATLFDKLWWDR